MGTTLYIACKITNVIGDEIVPKRGETILEERSAEKGAIHDDLNLEGDKNRYECSRQYSFQYLPHKSHIYPYVKVSFGLDRNNKVITPEDDKLEVRDEANDDEDQDIDVPFESKIQQDLSMSQRIETNIQLIGKIGMAGRIETKIDLTSDHPPCVACDLIVSESKADF